MTALTVELPQDLYEQLQAEATHEGASIQQFVQRLLTEQPHPTIKPLSDRERATDFFVVYVNLPLRLFRLDDIIYSSFHEREQMQCPH